MKVTIAPETEQEYELIKKVNDLAFNRINEGQLVEKLRNKPCFIRELSLVAKYKEEIIGYALFYPIKIKNDSGTCNSLSLGPVSVLPKYQNKGVGSKLIKTGLEIAGKLGFKAVIVIGHPRFYPRFGFEKASKWRIVSPYPVPEEAFLAKELVANGLNACDGTIQYPKEFDECV